MKGKGEVVEGTWPARKKIPAASRFRLLPRFGLLRLAEVPWTCEANGMAHMINSTVQIVDRRTSSGLAFGHAVREADERTRSSAGDA